MKVFSIITVLCCSLFLAGCGESDPLNRQGVTGEIKIQGEPVADGTIEFSPVANGTSSGAQILEGKFEIPAQKGLPPGEYIVRISAYDSVAEPVSIPGESNKIAEELIPAKYNTESEIKLTVKPDTENVFNLDIE